MPSKNVKSSASKSSSVKATPARWWNQEIEAEGALNAVRSLGSKMSTLPNDVGVLRMFDTEFGVKMCDANLMSAVDENKKLCISLTDEQYDFLKKVEDLMKETLIAKVKMIDPKYENADFMSCVKVSESTGQKYIKTKVQLLGRSRSFGVNLDGTTCINPLETLVDVGSVMDVRIRVDGVYVTKERAGLVTKIDLFRLKSIPSEEDKEAHRASKRAKMDADREAELKNF
jgi:hypothetical protein